MGVSLDGTPLLTESMLTYTSDMMAEVEGEQDLWKAIAKVKQIIDLDDQIYDLDREIRKIEKGIKGHKRWSDEDRKAERFRMIADRDKKRRELTRERGQIKKSLTNQLKKHLD